MKETVYINKSKLFNFLQKWNTKELSVNQLVESLDVSEDEKDYLFWYLGAVASYLNSGYCGLLNNPEEYNDKEKLKLETLNYMSSNLNNNSGFNELTVFIEFDKENKLMKVI